MQVEINVLGPFEATVSGVSVVPTAAKPSQLLALLALNAGHIVTVSWLMDEIWDQNCPRRATSTLQTYILQLRRRLTLALADNGRRTSKDILVTKRAGYVLEIDPEQVDAVRYERLAALGRRAINEGDYEKASGMLHDALSLWRGPALVDLVRGPQLEIESVRLEASRLTDLELRIDADLRLGRHHQLLGELATLCARHPMLETFCAQYMLALYRSGRQWRALEVYRGMRDTIVDQLGIDPSPRLRRLHHGMLAGDYALDDPNFVTSGWVPGQAQDPVPLTSRQVAAVP